MFRINSIALISCFLDLSFFNLQIIQSEKNPFNLNFDESTPQMLGSNYAIGTPLSNASSSRSLYPVISCHIQS